MGFATHSGKFPEIVRSFLGDLPKVKRTVANCGTSYYGYDFQYSMRPKGIATSWYVPISIFMCIYIYIYVCIYIYIYIYTLYIYIYLFIYLLFVYLYLYWYLHVYLYVHMMCMKITDIYLAPGHFRTPELAEGVSIPLDGSTAADLSASWPSVGGLKSSSEIQWFAFLGANAGAASQN